MTKLTDSMFDTSCDTCICNKCQHNTKYGFNQCFDCFDCCDCFEGNNHCEGCSMFEEEEEE